MSASASDQDKPLRLDKWLWQARFFKTRGNATAAILQGGFRVDGEIVSKPHRQARPGQVLTFRQGERTRIVRVLELGARRGPASEAALLYEDLSPNPPAPRPGKSTLPGFEMREAGSGRPTKKDRRATQRLKT